MLDAIQSLTGLPDGELLHVLVALVCALSFVLFCDLVYRIFVKIFSRR